MRGNNMKKMEELTQKQIYYTFPYTKSIHPIWRPTVEEAKHRFHKNLMKAKESGIYMENERILQFLEELSNANAYIIQIDNVATEEIAVGRKKEHFICMVIEFSTIEEKETFYLQYAEKIKKGSVL